jgi:Glyoxalase-like domain
LHTAGFAVCITLGFTANTVVRLDHISVIAPSLAAGSDYVEAALGVAPGPGRSHPNMGTHNLLLALGPTTYLEVISVDPGMSVTRARWFGLDHVQPKSAPRLAAWVASTNDIASVVTAELGEVETMQRDVHTWQMAVRSDGAIPLGGAAPLLIQRAPGANPVAALPKSDLRLERLLIRHPDPTQVLALLHRLGLQGQADVTVEFGSACCLVAEVLTPSGLRRLGEA